MAAVPIVQHRSAYILRLLMCTLRLLLSFSRGPRQRRRRHDNGHQLLKSRGTNDWGYDSFLFTVDVDELPLL